MQDFVPYLPRLGGVLAFLCLLAALRSGKRQRLIDDTPTSKTTGVFIGLVELKGSAEAETPLTSYLAGQPCVHYAWKVEEHWSRTVVETYTDSEGRTKTRTRHESGWTTVADGGEMIPFYLQDDCGVIRIQPEGAKIEPVTIFQDTCSPASPLYYGKGPAHAVPNSDFRRRFTEIAIPLRAQLYVMGRARERDDVVAAEIAGDKDAPMFLISTRSEEAVSRGFAWGYWSWLLLGLVLAPGGLVARDTAMGLDPATRLPWYFVAGFGYLATTGVGWVWMAFNSLISLRQRVRQGWSQIDVQLKRRHDLIPNLVQTVQGLRDYEQNLQVELAELRNQLAATPPGESGADPRGCAPILLAVAERYPELKAQPAFANLQKNLIDTEQRIALARGYFNEIATFYNTRLEIVPDRFIAALARMQPQVLLAATAFERAPVEVSFAN